MNAATTLSYIDAPGEQEQFAARGIKWQLGVATYQRMADAATNEYVGPDKANLEFARHFAKLQTVADRKSLWPDGAEGPTSLAIALGATVLDQLQRDELLPTRIVASADGGIAICFIDGDKYADVECSNNGEILGVISNRRDRPIAWEIEQSQGGVARAVVRIRDFLHPSQARADVPTKPWRLSWLSFFA
jgi:hypothetical protein